MTAFDTYYSYLRTRSLKGLIYRRLFLYPRLSKQLSGVALDIGCGIGDFLAFRKETVGVDINPKLVAHCHARGLTAHVMAPDVLPFGDGSFDAGIMDNVLEHINEPGPLLAEAHRVLKPGATLVIGVPGQKGYQADPDHKIFYNEERLIRRLADSGFELKRSFYMPLPSTFLAHRLTQHCLYATFKPL
ncbi:class I SAM-dependent methyltransferase [Ahrensia marina]|uniref:class I SAM-dependent methyltransferase n=1 Tax=Ahrensia marina TaxID=1514904 RepID=UPI0035D0304D